MSSRDKDLLDKQDITSKSNDSHSDTDAEVHETEENMEGLKIEVTLATKTGKGDFEKSKQLDFLHQEAITTSKDDLPNEPTAGPSGLQKLLSNSANSRCSILPDSKNGKDVELKGTSENTRVRKAAADTDTTDSMPPSTLSSQPILPFKQTASTDSSSSFRDEKSDQYEYPPLDQVYRRYFRNSEGSSSSRRGIYASDSANTSSDISEMPSEIADTSIAESVYHDAPEVFEKEQTPSYKSALEEQNSEDSDTSISDIQNDSFTTESSSSLSISTPSGEGYRNFIEECQREANEREQLSTFSGIGSSDQSEMINLEQWLGRERIPRGNFDSMRDSQNPNNFEHEVQTKESQTTSEPMGDEPITEQEIQDFDRLFQRNVEEPNMPRQGSALDAACLLHKFKKREQVSNIIAVSPSDRRNQTISSSDFSSAAKDEAGKLGSRIRPSMGRKSKVVPKKSKDTLRSSSESTEPKSTSSDEFHRQVSTEISSSESSKSERGKLYSSLRSTSSIDSIKTEHVVPPGSKSMETKAVSPEKMETAPEKDDENVAKTTKQANSELSVLVSSDQASVSETEVLNKQEPSFEDEDIERKAGKSKRREAKLSVSPPSDRGTVSSHKKTIHRLQKKARPDAEPTDKGRISDDSLPKIANTDSPKQSGSNIPSESDNESPDERN